MIDLRASQSWMHIRISWSAYETIDAQAPLAEILFQLVQGRIWTSFGGYGAVLRGEVKPPG